MTGLSGLAAMLAWSVAYAVGLGLPGADATQAQLVAYADDHAFEVQTFGILLSLGAIVLLAFLVGLSHILRSVDASLGRLVTIGLLSGVALQTLVIVGCALIQFQVFAADPAVEAFAPYTNTVAYLVFAFSAWPTVLMLCAYGVAIVRAGGYGFASMSLAFAAAAVHVGAGLSLARSGVLSLSGPVAELAPAVLFLWVICVSADLLVRRRLDPLRTD
ncbi:MAG TPA: hypothetical protein VFG86_10030 [Chloroflexota bacterium]|nr:hypothetical protein [Chloroflexota bacterium]